MYKVYINRIPNQNVIRIFVWFAATAKTESSGGRQDLFLIKILAIAVTVHPCLGVVFTNAFYSMGLAICKRSS